MVKVSGVILASPAHILMAATCRSQYRRFQDLGVDNQVPGPGRYFDDREVGGASLFSSFSAYVSGGVLIMSVG